MNRRLADVSLVFGCDDEDGFFAARSSLLELFERWLVDDQRRSEREAAEVAGEAGVALDWKWSYGDGDLGRWQTQDVAEFLLEWCPRKLSVSPAGCRSIPAALTAFTAFLGATGRLAPGSAPVAALSEAVTMVSDDFVVAMGDPSNFGLAKSLFSSAVADGVDLDDTDQVQQWIAEFNARPMEDRRQVIPGPAVSPPRRPAMPPVALPDDDEVAAARADAPILAMFATFSQFFGEGRKLTQTGNITLADARALVDVLATGDVMDERIGDRTFRTRSSAELPRLRQIFAWAKKAGVVRVVHGKLVATKRGLAMAGAPAAFFDRAVDALLAMGPLASQRNPDGWFAWPEVDQLLDRLVVHLLAGPYVAQRPLPIADLAGVAADAVLEGFVFPSLGDDDVARRVGTDVVDIVDALELAGVVRRSGTVDPADDELWVSRRRQGGHVELTPAGVATTHRLLAEAGYEVPVAGRFADASATELLLATDPDDLSVLLGEIEAWRRRREPAQAAAELAHAVRELDDPALRHLALVVMADIGTEIAGPEVRELAADPRLRGLALCWLVDRGLEDPAELFDPEDVGWFVDVLAQRLVTAGPQGLCDTLALAGNHDAQVAVLRRLWRSPSTATDTVLAAIGTVHPTKTVAKAARKARFQRRSWASA